MAERAIDEVLERLDTIIDLMIDLTELHETAAKIAGVRRGRPGPQEFKAGVMGDGIQDDGATRPVD